MCKTCMFFQHLLSFESCTRAHMNTATLHHISWRKSRIAMRFLKNKHVGLHVRTANECCIPILHKNTNNKQNRHAHGIWKENIKQAWRRRKTNKREGETQTCVKEKRKHAMREGKNKHAWRIKNKHASRREKTCVRERNATCVREKMQHACGRKCNMREREQAMCVKEKCTMREEQMQRVKEKCNTREGKCSTCEGKCKMREGQNACATLMWRGHAPHPLSHAHIDMTRTTHAPTQHDKTTMSFANTSHAIVEINNMCE